MYSVSPSPYGDPRLELKSTHHLKDDDSAANESKRSALKLILDLYNKEDTFSGSVDEYWNCYVNQFSRFWIEYTTDNPTRLRYFVLKLQATELCL